MLRISATFFTLADGPSKDSVFGYAYFPAILSLAVWAGAMSTANHRTKTLPLIDR